MALEKHDLAHEFPQYKEKIHDLKINDRHFAKLFDEYHTVEHEVHRIEVGAESSSDSYLEERKKIRLNLKDQLLLMMEKN